MEYFLLNPLFIILLLVGLVFVLASAVTRKFPPREINPLYGYRTAASMASPERWEFAQQLSAGKMQRIGLLALLLALLGAFVPLHEGVGVVLALLILFALVGWLLYSTEQAIKERFGKG